MTTIIPNEKPYHIYYIIIAVTPIIAQSTISGKVTDDFNAPLPFANIILPTKRR